MKKVKWAKANGIYIMYGYSCAKNLFMKDKKCHKIFCKNLNRFASKFGQILNYKVNECGWAILIKTYDQKTIAKEYLKQRQKSKKANRAIDVKEDYRMISEFIRYFLSSTALQCNHHLGRSGVMVKKRFEKLWISNQADYEKAFELVCKIQDYKRHQLKEHYQPPMEDYENAGVDSGSLLRCGVVHYKRSSCDGCWVEGPVRMFLLRPRGDVLRQFFNPNKPNNKIPPDP